VSFGTTKYSHSTLGYISETVIPLLSMHGLSHSWEIHQEAKDITVTCKVAHILGHSASVSMTSPPDDSGSKNKIQQVASTVTYLQRYTLLSALGLATDETDDDGRGAGAKKPVQEPIAEGDEIAFKLNACASLEELQSAWAEIPNAKRPKYTPLKDAAKIRIQGGQNA